MALGDKPKCSLCKTTSSSIWTKNEEGEIVCQTCSSKTDTPPSNGKSAPTLRKSTRAKSSKVKGLVSKNSNTKGKSRRYIFKKSCNKAPTSVATPVTSQSLFHKGIFFQVGDIVSIISYEGKVFYAQIRGLLQDQYCEKSAVITWLLPTVTSPKDCFDPATFIIGPEEDLPRKLDSLEFVCHAPSDYYRVKNSPYPVLAEKPDSGYVWTRVGPRPVPLPTLHQVFGAS